MFSLLSQNGQASLVTFVVLMAFSQCYVKFRCRNVWFVMNKLCVGNVSRSCWVSITVNLILQ